MYASKPMTLSRRALGTFALAALMSVLLIKFFSELALAAEEPSQVPRTMPSLSAPARILGTYQVTRIDQELTAHSKRRNRCEPGIDSHGKTLVPDMRCGDLIWVVRTDDQVALVSMSKSPEKDAILESALFMPPLSLVPAPEKCQGSVELSLARSSLFSSRFCRATRLQTSSLPDSEVFAFYDTVPPATLSAESGILGTHKIVDGIFGFPTEMGSSQVILLPKNDPTSPAQITVNERIATTNIALFIPGFQGNGVTSVVHSLTLTRVGE